MDFNLKKTAVISLDVQYGILEMMGEEASSALSNAESLVASVRKTDCRLMHVGLGFEDGYPEVNPKHPRFSLLKERGVFLKESDSARIHSSIFKAEDLVIHKHRVSAFSGNALQTILRSQNIETLVLFGFATSGIVLSTLRAASDLDFQCVVIKDACFDRDSEVHRILTEKVFSAQATVLNTKEFQSNVLSL